FRPPAGDSRTRLSALLRLRPHRVVPYRGFTIRRLRQAPARHVSPTVCRLQVGDTAQARPSRNPIVIVLLLVLVLDRPISDDENEDDDEDERFTRPATIWTDTDRLQVCATGASNSVNRYPTEPEDS